METRRDAALAFIDDMKNRGRALLWNGTFEVVDDATGGRIEKEQSQINFTWCAENMARQMGNGAGVPVGVLAARLIFIFLLETYGGDANVR